MNTKKKPLFMPQIWYPDSPWAQGLEAALVVGLVLYQQNVALSVGAAIALPLTFGGLNYLINVNEPKMAKLGMNAWIMKNISTVEVAVGVVSGVSHAAVSVAVLQLLGIPWDMNTFLGVAAISGAWNYYIVSQMISKSHTRAWKKVVPMNANAVVANAAESAAEEAAWDARVAAQQALNAAREDFHGGSTGMF